MSPDLFQWVVAIGIAVSAIAFLAQAVFIFGAYRSVKQMQARVASLAERAEPILDSAVRMVEESRPKILQITTEASEITRMAKVEVARISELVTDISDRARMKVAVLDAAVENAAENLQSAASTVSHAVLRPLREINGLLNGVRAALSALVHGRQAPVDRATQDEAMFI